MASLAAHTAVDTIITSMGDDVATSTKPSAASETGPCNFFPTNN